MLQMVGKCPCSLFQEMRFGLHVPLGAEFPSSLAGQFESDYLGNATSHGQKSFRQLALVLPLCLVLLTITE